VGQRGGWARCGIWCRSNADRDARSGRGTARCTYDDQGRDIRQGQAYAEQAVLADEDGERRDRMRQAQRYWANLQWPEDVKQAMEPRGRWSDGQPHPGNVQSGGGFEVQNRKDVLVRPLRVQRAWGEDMHPAGKARDGAEPIALCADGMFQDGLVTVGCPGADAGPKRGPEHGI